MVNCVICGFSVFFFPLFVARNERDLRSTKEKKKPHKKNDVLFALWTPSFSPLSSFFTKVNEKHTKITAC